MLDLMCPALLVGAGLIIVSVLTSLLAFRIGAPLLLIFLSIGLIAGEDGLGIEFDNAALAYMVGSTALAVILFDSGFGTKLSSFRTAAQPATGLRHRSSSQVPLVALFLIERPDRSDGDPEDR